MDSMNADTWNNQPTPTLQDTREQIVDSLSAYQMTSILEGVTIRGTGAKLKALNRHLAGKTGTTNDNKDGWFIGFSPDLVVGTYVGFDEPRTLGKRETGATVALPIFYDIMQEALKDTPNEPFRIPEGIKLVRINHTTGKPALPSDKAVIFEALKPDFDFNRSRVVGDNEEVSDNNTLSEDNDIQIGTQY
jgi:penicillin-binding protein 1A